MPRFLRPLTRAVTYTRWLHVLLGAVPGLTCASIYGMSDAGAVDLFVGFFVLPIPLGVVAGLLHPAAVTFEHLLRGGRVIQVATRRKRPGLTIEEHLWWTLRQLAASGKTVFVSSHILSEIQQTADRVAIIARGRLVTSGPVSEVLAARGGGGAIRERRTS